jgi:hypothetical protein
MGSKLPKQFKRAQRIEDLIPANQLYEYASMNNSEVEALFTYGEALWIVSLRIQIYNENDLIPETCQEAARCNQRFKHLALKAMALMSAKGLVEIVPKWDLSDESIGPHWMSTWDNGSKDHSVQVLGKLDRYLKT